MIEVFVFTSVFLSACSGPTFDLAETAPAKPLVTAEQAQRARAIRSMRVTVEQGFGEAEGVVLPFAEVAAQVLNGAGVAVVATAAPADATLAVKANGQALSATYSSAQRGSFRSWSGASLAGRITLSGRGGPAELPFGAIVRPALSVEDGAFSQPGQGPFLLQAFYQSGGFVSVLMDWVGQVYGEKAVLPLLTHANPDLRRNAAETLGRLRASTAVAPLTAALRDAEPAVQAQAATALGQIGDSRSVAPLIAILQDPNWLVQRAAAEALGRLRDRRAEAPLRALLKNPQKLSPDVKAAAEKALRTIGGN